MSDKEYLMDILSTEKSMSVDMSYALNEASSKHLYDTYFDMFESINKECKEVYNLAYKLGFYKLEEVEEKKITKAYDMLSLELSNLE